MGAGNRTTLRSAARRARRRSSAAGAAEVSLARERWVTEPTTTPSGAPKARHIEHADVRAPQARQRLAQRVSAGYASPPQHPPERRRRGTSPTPTRRTRSLLLTPSAQSGKNILPPLPEGDSGDHTSERDDQRRAGQTSPRPCAFSAFKRGDRVQKKLRPIGVYGFADTSHDSGVCDGLEIYVEAEVAVKQP